MPSPVAGVKNDFYQDCPPFLREFLNYSLSIRSLSPRTVDAYAVDLRTFFRFWRRLHGQVSADCPLEEIPIKDMTFDEVRTISKADVYEFIYYITSDRHNNAKTRARKLCSIKAFFKYYVNKKGLLEVNPAADVDSPALKKSLPKYLSLEECLELLRSVQTEFPERDFCILTLFLNCGMRLSELVGINLTDFKENTIRIIGKGNKERTVYLTDACRDAIGAYLPIRAGLEHLVDRNAMFVSKRTGKRLTGRRVEQIVGDCMTSAGLADKGYSPHKLRHTAATLMYRSGKVDMLALQEILGHANVSTTQIYTHISRTQLAEAVQASPLAHLHGGSAAKNKKQHLSTADSLAGDTEEDGGIAGTEKTDDAGDAGAADSGTDDAAADVQN